MNPFKDKSAKQILGMTSQGLLATFVIVITGWSILLLLDSFGVESDFPPITGMQAVCSYVCFDQGSDGVDDSCFSQPIGGGCIPTTSCTVCANGCNTDTGFCSVCGDGNAKAKNCGVDEVCTSNFECADPLHCFEDVRNGFSCESKLCDESVCGGCAFDENNDPTECTDGTIENEWCTCGCQREDPACGACKPTACGECNSNTQCTKIGGNACTWDTTTKVCSPDPSTAVCGDGSKNARECGLNSKCVFPGWRTQC